MNRTININAVAEVAAGLRELCGQMVFVGGAVISLYTDDAAADEVRPTDDIDMTLELASFAELVRLQEKLAGLGFSPDPAGHAICSYRYRDIAVDIMPAEDGPAGNANRWYKPGFAFLQTARAGEHSIRILSAPYFLATKFEAFNDRGGDYRTGHDFEDIVYIIDNRTTIVGEILAADENVRTFLREQLSKLMAILTRKKSLCRTSILLL